MSLPPNRPPFGDVYLSESTTSIATTPVAATMIAPCSGILRKVWAGANGATTGTTAVKVTISGNASADVAAGALNVPAGAGGNNQGVELAKVGINLVSVNEGDLITFTPSGGTGATIPGAFTAAIRPQ